MLFYQRVENQITTDDYMYRDKPPKTKKKREARQDYRYLKQKQWKLEVKRNPETERTTDIKVHKGSGKNGCSRRHR